jgi:hypothetical protein
VSLNVLLGVGGEGGMGDEEVEDGEGVLIARK